MIVIWSLLDLYRTHMHLLRIASAFYYTKSTSPWSASGSKQGSKFEVKQWLSKTMFSSVKDKPALPCSCCKQLEKTNKYHRLFQLTAPWKDLTTNTERKAQSHFMPNSKTATATAMHALKNSALKKHIKTKCSQQFSSCKSSALKKSVKFRNACKKFCSWEFCQLLLIVLIHTA